MDNATKAAFAKIDAGLEKLSNSAQAQADLIQGLTDRLDQLIAFLAPKDPGENHLADLLTQLVNLGHAQLRLAEQTFNEISKLSGDPSLSSHHPVLPASNGGRAL